jgi:DNA-directed RNA polymerase subunit omega
MARITVEDCLKKGYNKFMLVHLAAKRVVQLRKGKEPLVKCDNREVVTVLREIEKGKVSLRTEGSTSEAFLEREPELPAPTDDQIGPETTAEGDEEIGAEAAAEVDEQGHQETAAEDGAEVDATAQAEGEPKAEPEAPEIETDVKGEQDESTSDTV